MSANKAHVTALAAAGYRDMSLAPQDGTVILGLLPDSDVPHSIRYADGWRIAWDMYLLREFDEPLGWMPLPALGTDLIALTLIDELPCRPGRTLYIDLDGVMADFDGSFPTVFGLDHRSLADDDMWLHINGHETFFRDLPPMAGAVDFFRSVKHLQPVILTACPKSNYPHVAAQKRAWVREHLSQTCQVLPVLGGQHKPLFMHQPGDILIDDFGKNCRAWAKAGGVAIKHEGNWDVTRAALTAVLFHRAGADSAGGA